MLWLKNFWYNTLWGKKTPWVDVKYGVAGLELRGWNQAYVDLAISKIPEHARKDWSSRDVILNFVKEPEKKYAEAPRLDIVHMGLERDGVAKVKLDWNTEFILHLAENGISAETEEEAVQIYLQLLTAKKFDEFSENIEETFADYPDLEEVDGIVTGGAGEQFDETVGDGPAVRNTNRRRRMLDR